MNARMGAGTARPLALCLLSAGLLLFSIAPAQVLDTIIKLPGQPEELVRDFGRALYVRSSQPNYTDSIYLFVLDCSTDSHVGTIPLGIVGRNIMPYQALDWRRNVLYYSTPESGYVAAIDLLTDSIVATLRFAGGTWGMAYDSRDDRLYVCSRKLYAVDCSTRVATDSIPVLGEFFASWDSVDNKLYTGGGFNTDIVRVIDCATNTVKGIIHTRITPSIEFLAFSPAFDRLYLGNESDYFGGVIDCRSDAYTLLPEVGATVYSPVCNDLEGKVYWASDFIWYDSLTVMDMHDNSVLRKVPLEWRGGPCQVFGGMGLARWSNRLYFTWGARDSTGQFRSMLSALDCETDSILGTAEVARLPEYLYCNPYDQRIYITCYPPDSNVYVYRDEPAGGVEAPTAISPAVSFSVSPNPAEDHVTISASVLESKHIVLAVYDAAGRHVRTLDCAQTEPNVVQARWDGTDGRKRVSPGVYIIKLDAGATHLSRKVVLTGR